MLHATSFVRPFVCLFLSSPVFPPSQRRNLHNVLVGGAQWQVGVTLWGDGRRCGDADDGRGYLTALAVQACRGRLHSHVETGATEEDRGRGEVEKEEEERRRGIRRGGGGGEREGGAAGGRRW